MKNLKISLMAILAIALGIAGSAFTGKAPVKQKNLTLHYFEFMGSDNSNGQIQAASNWVDLGTDEPTLTCDKATGIVCYVEFDGTLSSYQTYVSNKTLANLQSAGIIDEYRQ